MNLNEEDLHDHENQDNEEKPIFKNKSKVGCLKGFDIQSNKFYMQITIATLTCLSTCLDGYLLIFIGYNNTILNKKWGLSSSYLLLIEIVYHLSSALGGIASIPTCHFGNKIGMNYNLILSVSAIVSTFCLYKTESYFKYLLTIGFICFCNGHLYNIGTNLIINKFSITQRGGIFALIYFFNQIGKLLFSVFIWKYNSLLVQGKIQITILPILALLLLQFVFNHRLIELYRQKFRHTKMNLIESINAKKGWLMSDLQFRKNNEAFNLNKWLFEHIVQIFTQSPDSHGVFMVIVNMSLGIQFFAMVNVFPLLKKPIPAFLTNEIFFSKITHTILLGIFTVFAITYCINAKNWLFYALIVNLVLNLSIMFDWFNSYWTTHLFRYVWNVSYVMNNIYCAEAILKKNRGTNTSFLYLMFKISCILEILFVNKIILFSVFLPIAINVFILLFDIVVVTKFEVETYLISVDQIDKQIHRMLQK